MTTRSASRMPLSVAASRRRPCRRLETQDGCVSRASTGGRVPAVLFGSFTGTGPPHPVCGGLLLEQRGGAPFGSRKGTGPQGRRAFGTPPPALGPRLRRLGPVSGVWDPSPAFGTRLRRLGPASGVWDPASGVWDPASGVWDPASDPASNPGQGASSQGDGCLLFGRRPTTEPGVGDPALLLAPWLEPGGI